MTERPILFSAPMVRAILDGTKRQTRRVIKPQPSSGVRFSPFVPSGVEDGHGREQRCPYAVDRLWVREAWCQAVDPITSKPIDSKALYRADGEEVFLDDGDGGHAVNKDGTFASPWRSPRFMPRWASRITLAVDSVRVERLHGISEEDARAEGAPYYVPGHGPVSESERNCDGGFHGSGSWRDGFENLWHEINGAGSWQANPFVWVVSFHRLNSGSTP